jgi:hypothetical protein
MELVTNCINENMSRSSDGNIENIKCTECNSEQQFYKRLIILINEIKNKV